MIVPIQALRAAAALSVALLHGQHEARLHAGGFGWSVASLAWLPWAAGVDVFFVISGFVMAISSRRLFARPGGRRVFLARRIARVVPLYWAVTTAYLGLALLGSGLVAGAVDPAYVAASYAFLPMARPDGSMVPLYGLGWTLNYEMAFYGLFALALGLPMLAGFAALLIALAAIGAVGAVATLPQPLAFWTDPIVLEFAAGLVLGLWRSEGVRLGRPARLVLAGAALALLAAVAGAGDLAGATRAVLWGLPAACLVAACGLGHDDPWREDERWTRLAATLGDASYALYLVHPFALRGVRVAVAAAGLGPAVPPLAVLAAGLVAATLAAVAVHRVFERPATRFVRARLEPRPATA